MDTKSTDLSTSALVPFKSQTFREIWVASLSSNLGGLVQSVGAAWMMTAITNSPNMVALVQASTALPIMLFSLTAGAIADNFERKRVMLTAQFFMLFVSAMLSLFAYLEILTPWLLLTFTFLIGCGTALNNPSWQTSVGDMVPRAHLPSAVALNSIGFNLTRSVGPAVGGAIVAAAGAAAAFLVNTLSYLPLIFVLTRWKPEPRTSALPRETLGMAMTAGLRYVAMSPNIKTVLMRTFVFGLASSSVLALLPLVARDLLQGGPLVYGAMLGSFGVGAIGGGFLSSRLRQHALSGESVVRLGFCGFALCAAVTALSTYTLITGAGLLVGGVCWVLTLQRFNVTVQLSTPRWVVGRALALYQTCTFGGLSVGSWLWGVIAEYYGADTALVSSSALLLAGAALGLIFMLPQEATLSLDPLGRWREPHLGLDLKPRSGPIVIMIDYVIREADTSPFLALMAERRRIRRRDGARNWNLARDLENPELWTESYHTPTWIEYIRQSQRATAADGIVADKIRALHALPEPPHVRRMIERPTYWSMLVGSAASPIDLH